MNKMHIFLVLILGVAGCSGSSDSEPEYKNNLVVSSGTVNGQSLSPSDPRVTVSAGESIAGEVTLEAFNDGNSGDIAPLAGTPSWGEHITSYWGIESWIPTQASTHTTIIDLTAPDSSGAYYLYFAWGYEATYSFVMSLTSWVYPQGEVWDDGVDVADWDDSHAQMAIDNGYVKTQFLTRDGEYVELNLPAAAIRVEVQ